MLWRLCSIYTYYDELLKENHDSENIESLVSKLTNVLNGALKGEDHNRKAILDAMDSYYEKRKVKRFGGDYMSKTNVTRCRFLRKIKITYM